MSKINENLTESIDLSSVRKPIRKNIYGKAYLDILENTVFNISNMAKFLYVYLDARQGKNGFIYEKQDTLAPKINISKRSLVTYLKELEDIGAIVKLQLHFKSNGNKFLDVLIPKEYNPFTLKFEDIENLEEIKQDILKVLPYCTISKNKSKSKSKAVDNVNNVDNLNADNVNETDKNVENDSVEGNKLPKCKNYTWGNKNPKCKNYTWRNCKICNWEIFKNGLKSFKPKCKICAAETEKASSFNNRKIENKKSSPPFSQSNENLWEAVKDNLKEQLTEVSYKTWIETSIIESKITNNIINLKVINDFCKDILEKRYAEIIKNTYGKFINQEFSIKFNV